MIDRTYPHRGLRAKWSQAANSLKTGAMAVLFLTICAAQSNAAITEIHPSNADDNCNEEFENTANSLQPGDELILHGGTYSQGCRRAITVNGTASQPVVIRAAEGEIPILTNVSSENNIDVIDSSYMVIRGLHFQGGSQGIRFVGTNHHITLEENEVYDTQNNAIAVNSGNADSLTIRRNHIHNTGLASGPTEGEGMYLGCHTGSCRTTNSLIESNYIHHLRGTSSGGNDGIEVKVGSYGNVIRNNVIHDANIGTQYPCILAYGGGQDVNTVEGNVMWGCGEGIYVVSDAVVRNNIVLNSGAGITSYPHSVVPQMRNVTIVNNTIYGHEQCVFLRWTSVSNMLLANNAAYCPGNTAVDATGLGGVSIAAWSNYVEGGMSGASIDNSRFFSGGSTASAFVNAPEMDLWPKSGSILIGNANANHVPSLDFNETSRTSPYDVGAYETDGLSANPGWEIVAGFKSIDNQFTPPAAPTNLKVQ